MMIKIRVPISIVNVQVTVSSLELLTLLLRSKNDFHTLDIRIRMRPVHTNRVSILRNGCTIQRMSLNGFQLLSLLLWGIVIL
jgi:hypothetical protein